MINKKKVKKSEARSFLENMMGGPLYFGDHLAAIRKGEEMTLGSFAKLLGVSRQHLCDIEKGRRKVSPERAAKWARVLGYSETTMVQLALQHMVKEAGLKMNVSVQAA
jgi:transcriptional regulator with XRE-family HTH domain